MKNLLQVELNKEYIICELIGGTGFLKKMDALGIRKGIKIKKISDLKGPIILQVGNTKVAIGRGMAQKILVKEENE